MAKVFAMKKEGKEVIVAIIGGAALIISALITGFFNSATTRITIQATQTSEANISPVIIFTPTPLISITPAQVTLTLQPTPVPVISVQKSPLSTIPIRKDKLFLAISGIMLFFGFIGVFNYLPMHNSYKNLSVIPKVMSIFGFTGTANSLSSDRKSSVIPRSLVSVTIIAPFLLIWTSYFFLFPQNVSLQLVLFVALLYLAIFFWFPKFFFEKLKPLWAILLLLCSIYITIFSFTSASFSEAFIISTLISVLEIIYATIVFTWAHYIDLFN